MLHVGLWKRTENKPTVCLVCLSQVSYRLILTNWRRIHSYDLNIKVTLIADVGNDSSGESGPLFCLVTRLIERHAKNCMWMREFAVWHQHVSICIAHCTITNKFLIIILG